MFRRNNTSNDSMKEIFEKEYALQLRLYGENWPDDLNECIREYAMCLHLETDEMLQETNFRHKQNPPKINLSKLQFEVVDVFLMSLAAATVCFSEYEDFVDAVHRKMSHNDKRRDWEAN